MDNEVQGYCTFCAGETILVGDGSYLQCQDCGTITHIADLDQGGEITQANESLRDMVEQGEIDPDSDEYFQLVDNIVDDANELDSLEYDPDLDDPDLED